MQKFTVAESFIFVGKNHHTFAEGVEVVIHKDHSEADEAQNIVRVCDPDAENEFWIVEMADLKMPSPEDLQRIKDERYVCLVVGTDSGKDVEVTRENVHQVMDDMQIQIAQLQTDLTAIRKIFGVKN